MKYKSTRDKSSLLSFSECLTQGLAPDGGLYVPKSLSALSAAELRDLAQTELLSAFAAKLLFPFVAGSALAHDLPAITNTAMNFPTPLVFSKDDSKTATLELFHGPTAAFKDVGARFLAQCMIRLKTHATVIVATSGDTGGAVAAAFSNQPGIKVVILYPKGKISARQEKQLTNHGPTVRAFAVHGSFDDCQRVVKEALSDSALHAKHHFISANSISIGRLLPQMCYHAKASLDYQTKTGRQATLIVPTGNLGNAVAALWAKRMGFPIERVILATNANRTLIDYFETGRYESRSTIATLANAMDVSVPSNFERLQHLYPDLHFLKKDVAVVSVTDKEIAEVIKMSATKNNPTETTDPVLASASGIFCPHTATAVVAKEQLQIENAILVATAHPAKFETIIEPLIHRAIEIPKNLAATLEGVSVSQDLEPSLSSLASSI